MSVPHFKHLERHSDNGNHKDQLRSCECLDGFRPFGKDWFKSMIMITLINS